MLILQCTCKPATCDAGHKAFSRDAHVFVLVQHSDLCRQRQRNRHSISATTAMSGGTCTRNPNIRQHRRRLRGTRPPPGAKHRPHPDSGPRGARLTKHPSCSFRARSSPAAPSTGCAKDTCARNPNIKQHRRRGASGSATYISDASPSPSHASPDVLHGSCPAPSARQMSPDACPGSPPAFRSHISCRSAVSSGLRAIVRGR